MADVSTALAGNRVAVDDLLAAADRTGAAWTTPRAPGKWSPSQVVEHVARALEESANVVAGTPSKFPTFAQRIAHKLRPAAAADKNADGTWRVARDAWNTDLPLPNK